MLTLHSLDGSIVPFPYYPDMPVWQYLREVFAPAMGFEVDNGKTVRVNVIARNQLFDYNVRHRLLGEMIEDGGKLYYTRVYGPTFGKLQGNACPDGGSSNGCTLCGKNTFNFSLDCMHRFHTKCLWQHDSSFCPVCGEAFIAWDREQLAMSKGLDNSESHWTM